MKLESPLHKTLKFQLEWACPGLQPMPLGLEARITPLDQHCSCFGPVE